MLKDASISALSGLIYMGLPEKLFAHSKSRSKVVLIRHKDLYDKEFRLRAEIVREMLDQAVMEISGKENIPDAWKAFIKPSDVVGIKTNVWTYMPTPVELESAIKQRVMECGVPEKDISINDRGVRHDLVFKRATALINSRPMHTHDWSGVGSCIKNYIVFCESPSSLHPDSCADLAKPWFYPEVKGKTRLNILVMFSPLFHGVGPHHYNKKYTWAYNGMIVGVDPVAVDATGLRIIEAKRKEYFNDERPISPSPKHIGLADTRHHLGNSDPANIELITMGWEEGLMI
jgi:hypothetical protein